MPLRSFGRRKGRKLSPRQTSLLDGSLHRLQIRLDRPAPSSGLQDIFGPPVQDAWLEIGFGAGEHLIWQALNNPAAGLIGAEPYVNGVVAALSASGEHRLQDRVRIHAGDVHSLLDWLPPASISRVFMLFPDPWPKKRHRERRLFSRRFLERMQRILKPGAELRFASDIADYAEAAVELVRSNNAFELQALFTSAGRQSIPDWPVTRYERKAIAAGRSATFVIARRMHNRD